MKPTVPAAGPLWLDLRSRSAIGAVDLLETILLRGRGGARRVIVRVAHGDAQGAVRDWADDLDVPFTMIAMADHIELHLYLLPLGFDQHPLFDHPHRARAARTDRYTTPTGVVAR